MTDDQTVPHPEWHTTPSDLGTIEKCDVRLTWPHEGANFTPWLAKEENIRGLGDAIGLELEVEGIEVAVGPFWADILAKDVGTAQYVIIENQLAKTNHDHLGKAITYGAVLNASAIVWVATEFTDEHTRALDWLNDNTAEALAFYGVQVELWKIDNSRPAIRFNVVSRPTELGRKVKVTKPTDDLTDAKKLQLDFWTLVRDKLLETKTLATTHTPRPQYWFDVALGRTGIFLSNIANTFENRIGVRVYLTAKVAEKALSQLIADKQAIEEELGTALTWNPNPDKNDKIIVLLRDADLWDRDDWDSHVAWMVKTIGDFRRVFMPRVKGLDLAD